jgi:hypothetical protein
MFNWLCLALALKYKERHVYLSGTRWFINLGPVLLVNGHLILHNWITVNDQPIFKDYIFDNGLCEKQCHYYEITEY